MRGNQHGSDLAPPPEHHQQHKSQLGLPNNSCSTEYVFIGLSPIFTAQSTASLSTPSHSNSAVSCRGFIFKHIMPVGTRYKSPICLLSVGTKDYIKLEINIKPVGFTVKSRLPTQSYLTFLHSILKVKRNSLALMYEICYQLFSPTHLCITAQKLWQFVI